MIRKRGWRRLMRAIQVHGRIKCKAGIALGQGKYERYQQLCDRAARLIDLIYDLKGGV